jgi:hypothetical protein
MSDEKQDEWERDRVRREREAQTSDDEDAGDDDGEERSSKSGGGISRVVSGAKYVVGKVFNNGLKGALIGAVAVPVVAGVATVAGLTALPFGIGAIIGLPTAAAAYSSGALGSVIGGLALNGAMIGGAVGGGWGAISGISNAGEYVDSEEMSDQMRSQRAEQMSINREIMHANLQRVRGMNQLQTQRMQDQLASGHGLGARGRGQNMDGPAMS